MPTVRQNNGLAVKALFAAVAVLNNEIKHLRDRREENGP